MGSIRIEISVHGHAELEELLDKCLEVRVRTEPGACERCIANAGSDNPEMPPLHQHCRCTVEFVNA